jgi:hypothetical protein
MSWHGADVMIRGREKTARLRTPRDSQTPRSDGGFIRWAAESSSTPIPAGSRPIAARTSSIVPNRFIKSGVDDPFGRSNNKAGPPSRKMRWVISVTSSSGSTSTLMRLSCPF